MHYNILVISIMISILMPIYNGIEFINESVLSVLNQTYHHWELIIGINGHPPNSDAYLIAKTYELLNDNIRVFDLHNNNTKSQTLNELLNYCNYEWVSLLDVDDKWLPTKLQSQIQYMENFDIIGTQCRYFGDLSVSPNIPLGHINKYDFSKVNPIINSSCLLRKELCFWDGTYNLEDYDLWIRLWKQGKQFYNVNSIQVMHRIHTTSAFNAKGNNNNVQDMLSIHFPK